MAREGWSSGKQTTVTEVFEAALAMRGPSFDYIDYNGRKYTLGELQERSIRLAHGLLAAGARAGECVTSVLDNSVEQLLLLLACSRIGAVHVPLNTAYKGDFLRHQVADSAAPVLVAEREYVERLLEIEDGLPDARTLLVKGEIGARPAKRLDLRSLDEAFTANPSEPLIPAKPSDLAMLIYTAGTTGPSKGCMVSQNYVCHMAWQIAENMLYNKDDVIWTPLPGFHANQYTATILSSLMVGARAAVYTRFSVSNFWPEVERTGATVTQILSTMVALIADAPDNDAAKRYYGKLRVAGGTPFPKVLQDKWRERFGAHTFGQIGFGLTECAIVTSCRVDEPRPANASGRVDPDFDVRIVDDHDNEVAPGTPGEIIVRPKMPHVMFEGYWRRPAETMKVLRNFWFHTGDIGRFDDDGWFYFLDRKKDYLRRRGENISSMELEAVFRSHGAIREVAVHAVLADMEDDVKVTCTLVEGAEVTEEELCRWSIEKLPYFAVPRFIEFRPELPKNPVGRVLKYALRDDGITAATWDRDKSAVQLVKR
ncbi:MAG: AMP-binding protein [Azospirillaceae bacterium]|nr:AMP-binding protein [Azospirillaceae bacterium]